METAQTQQTEDTIDRHGVGEILAQRLRQRYVSMDHPHPAERCIGASTLTSRTIEEITQYYADWLHRGVWAQKETGPSGKPMREYTFSGDVVADAAFDIKNWRSREFIVQAPLSVDPTLGEKAEGWSIKSHPDAGGVFDADGEPCTYYQDLATVQQGPHPDTTTLSVWMGEHKLHGDATRWDVEKARRQDLLNLATAWHQRQQSDNPVIEFPRSRWGGDPFYWPNGVQPGGIILGIVSSTGPNRVEYHPAEPEMLDELLEYYARKAVIAIEGAIRDDVQWAIDAWNAEGGKSEFDMAIANMTHTSPVEDVVARYKELQMQIKDLNGELAETKVDMERAMVAAGIWDRALEEKLPVGHYTFKRVRGKNVSADTKALREADLTQYIRETHYDYPQIKPRGDVGG